MTDVGPLGAMAEAVEAPSAMDGMAVGRRVEKLFSLSSAFVRAAVTSDLIYTTHDTLVRLG